MMIVDGPWSLDGRRLPTAGTTRDGDLGRREMTMLFSTHNSRSEAFRGRSPLSAHTASSSTSLAFPGCCEASGRRCDLEAASSSGSHFAP